VLGKYLKFIWGGGGGDKLNAVPLPASKPAIPPSSSLGGSISLLDSFPPVVAEESIDTGHVAADSVVASVPEIETTGPRTDANKLRQKIIGRQPILNRSQQIIGYELLLRSKALPTVKSPDAALRRMQDEALIRCLMDLDINRLLEDKQAFVGISSAMLGSPLLRKLPSKGVVLLVCPDQDKLEDNLLRCRELRGLGYQIALDDFEVKRGLGQFLPLASFIRVDVARFNAIELGKLADHFLDKATPQLLAKNVETDDDFEACYKMQFHCFEGNYFTRLRPSLPPRVDTDRIRVMELLNMVKNQKQISQLEEGFKHDAMLSYKLLRYINAPVNGLQQQIHSIAHALVLLGYKHLYRWLTLLLFASGKADPRSRALLQNALVRARMTELLGQGKLPLAEREGLFIVGIFSLLDVLLNVPMEQALAHLQLPDPVMAALGRREGIYAPFLALSVACEAADQEAIIEQAAICGLDADEVNIAQVKALVWAEEIEL
jgi:EAL and modified HD-GYP domain-containing signal transduction protein